jgi:hypothetical protein
MTTQTTGKTILVKIWIKGNNEAVMCYIPPYLINDDETQTAKEQLSRWMEGEDFLNAYMNYYDLDNSLNGKRVFGYELGPQSSYEIMSVLDDLIIDDLPQDEL